MFTMQSEINFQSLLGDDSNRIIKFCMNTNLMGNRYVCPKCANDMKLVKRADVID